MSFVALRVGLRWERRGDSSPHCHLLSISLQLEDSRGMSVWTFVWGITRVGEEFEPEGCFSLKFGDTRQEKMLLQRTDSINYSKTELSCQLFRPLFGKFDEESLGCQSDQTAEIIRKALQKQKQHKNRSSFSRTKSLSQTPINYIWLEKWQALCWSIWKPPSDNYFSTLTLPCDKRVVENAHRLMRSLSGEHFISQAVMSSFVLTLTPSIP